MFPQMMSLSVIPTPGMLMGTVVDQSILGQLNSSFVPDGIPLSQQFTQMRDRFVERFIQPFRDTYDILKHKIILDDADVIKVIDSMEAIYRTPPAMYLPILTYKPVRDLFNAGRIDGYGMEFVPEDDPYGRLIDNGSIELLIGMAETGEVEFVYEWTNNDPDLDLDEIEMIENTREYIDRFLKETVLDPTNPNKRRG